MAWRRKRWGNEPLNSPAATRLQKRSPNEGETTRSALERLFPSRTCCRSAEATVLILESSFLPSMISERRLQLHPGIQKIAHLFCEQDDLAAG